MGDAETTDEPGPAGPGRRRFLAAAGGAAAAGAVGGAALGRYVVPAGDAGTSTSDGRAEAVTAALVSPAFTGPHQAGVVDRPPAHLLFTAYDLPAATSAGAARTSLRAALQALTDLGAAVTAGAWTAAQDDVVTGLRPGHVTLTIGLGAGALAAAGLPVPGPLAPLPTFNNDQLDPARSGGDLAVQVCAEDAQLAFSVARAARVALGGAAPRWQQRGFLPGVAVTDDVGATRRNLLGQLDGSGNPTGAQLTAAVWANDPATSWMTGGTYLVCRRIRLMLTAWERLSTAAKEQVIGRSRTTGAPLGREHESDPMDFALLGTDGRPVVAANAHVRLTHPDLNGGATMFRRAYAFDDGVRADGEPDAGLFFQAFQTDPRTVFVPIQSKLATLDALTPFVRHEASAVFAVPPGADADSFVGAPLFA